MSITDALTGRNKPGPSYAKPPYHRPQAPEIVAKLAVAEEALARAQEAFDIAAYETATGKAPESSLQAARTTLTGAREQVDILKVAHTMALKKDADALDASRQSVRRTQLEAVRKHCQARDRAAQALSDALAEAAKHYRELVEHSDKAIAACPIGATWPVNGGFHRIDRMVAAEMWRVSGANGKNRELPGSHTDTMHRDNPAGIAPLPDTISKSSTDAIARLAAFVKGAE